MRYIIWDSEDFKFEVEVKDRQPFLHLQVYKWGLDVARFMLKLIESAKAMLYIGGARAVYTVIPKSDDKAIRFNKLYGMMILTELEDTVLMGCKLNEPEKSILAQNKD